MDKKKDFYKIFLLGDSTVGKTDILFRYVENSFKENCLTTIGLDFKTKNIKMEDGKNIKLQIWDTAGGECFKPITKNYYKGADGMALIYDVTEEKYFYNLEYWINNKK